MRPCLALIALLLALPARAERCALDDEPPLPTLLRRATTRALLDPERLASIARRSRVAALLPRLQASASKGNYAYVRDPDSSNPTLVSSETWQLGGHLTWQLDRLVFNPSEVRAIVASGRLADRRAALLDRVVQLWATRRGLELTPGSRDDCTAFTALLDEMTGGALGPAREPPSRRSLPPDPPRR